MCRTIRLCLFLTAAALFVGGEAWALDWAIETVAYDGGQCVSLSLAPDGEPRAAYRVTVGGYLGYAALHTGGWTTTSIEKGGSRTSLAIDSAGNPHISHSNSTLELRYAVFDGVSWHTEPVDAAGSTSLALDGADLPRIAYNNDLGLRYSVWDGGSWSATTVDPDGSCDVSLALLPNGRPCIAYKSKGSTLTYAAWTGSEWSIETLDTPISDPSLALDSSGRPHIAYYLDGTQDLKYAYWDGTQWQFTTVDEAHTTGWLPSLALDVFDRPHIVYTDVSEDALKYATFDGLSWQIETVDTQGASYGSIAVDSGGNVHIVYGKSGVQLMYAYGTPEPATLSLIAAGLGAVLAARRRR